MAKKRPNKKAPTHRSQIEMASRTRSKKALAKYRKYQREYHRNRRAQAKAAKESVS